MSYIINLFGDGLRIYKCQINADEFKHFKKFKEKNNLSWESIFFDIDILNRLGFSDWQEFVTHETYGLIINPTNKIEIKKRTKNILKIQASDILNSELLFNLYHTTIEAFKEPTPTQHVAFQIITMEVGLIGKYKINASTFDVNALEFNLSPILERKNYLLQKIKYKTQLLQITKTDSLVRGMSIYFKE